MKYDYDKDYIGAVAKVNKLLGGDAPFPDEDLKDLIDAAEAARKAANGTFDLAIKLLNSYESAIDEILIEAKRYSNKMAKFDFKLDDRKPDDKKKIVEARAIMDKTVDDLEKQCKAALKVVDDKEKSFAGTLD